MPLDARTSGSTAVYGALLLILVLTSSPHTVGDGGEYLAYVTRFSRGAGPSVAADEMPQLHRDLAAIEPGLSQWDIEASMHVDRFGARHFVHFWLYPAIATPFVMLAGALHLDPRSGFTALHVILLTLACLAVARSAGWIVAWLLMAGPVLWWLDKPHPEVFLYTLLAIALAAWRERPIAALLCAGLVAAQVAPFAMIVPVIAAAALVDRPQRWHDRRFWIGVCGAAAVSAMAPVFYFWRFGEISVFTRLTTSRWPWAHFGTELFDLTIGLIPNWLMFGAAVLAALLIGVLSRTRELRRLDVITAALSVIVLLLVFPRIGNVTHGGTPGVSRYGLWLVPLAIPLFVALRGSRGWLWTSLALTAVSVPYSLVMFHPARPEYSNRPTALALWVWRHHPGWSTPLPRVFVSALRAPDETAPVATAGCTKALLIGRGEAQGMWPRACLPAPVPPECRVPAALCYANRDAATYRFTPVTSAQANFRYDPRRVWPKAAEAGVSSAMALAEWEELDVVDLPNDGEAVERVEGAQIEIAMQRDDRLFLVLRHVTAGMRVQLRRGPPARGMLINGETGAVIRVFTTSGGVDGSTLSLDDPLDTVVLALRPI